MLVVVDEKRSVSYSDAHNILRTMERILSQLRAQKQVELVAEAINILAKLSLQTEHLKVYMQSHLQFKCKERDLIRQVCKVLKDDSTKVAVQADCMKFIG